MVQLSRRQKKENYFRRFSKVLSTYDRAFVVCADNVRSKQLQQIRIALRGSAIIVFGKNTQMRKVISKQIEKDPRLERLIPLLKQNVGLVFTARDLNEVRSSLESNRLEAPAKAGTIAPKDVIVTALNTGLGPEKTSFFQALNIQTKITRGTIEILNDVHIIKKGAKVGQSEAALLKMLNINPFDYGLQIVQVFDQGSVYGPDVLDITNEDVIHKFVHGASNAISLSLGLGYPTFASAHHMLINGFQDLVALSVETDYTFNGSEKIKEYLADPSKFVVAAATPTVAAAAPAAAVKAPEPVESEKESDSDMNLGMFD